MNLYIKRQSLARTRLGLLEVYKTRQDLNQSVTFLKVLVQTNTRIYLYHRKDPSEYSNVFVADFAAERISYQV